MSAQAVLSPPAPVVSVVATPIGSVPPHRYTVEEYATLEQTSEICHEYVEGEIIPMPGISFPHQRIARTLTVFLDRAFEGTICEFFMESIRVRVSSTRYRYPDVIALCGEALTDDSNPPALLNPNLIVEVLSPSTEENDRNNKYVEYSKIASLTDYVMISQDRVSVFHCTRRGEREWNIKEFVQLTDKLHFASLGVDVGLEEIYRKVTFTEA